LALHSGAQCILNTTRGVAGIKRKFFLRAFGGDSAEFIRFISMPEHYIMNRDVYEDAEANARTAHYGRLDDAETDDFRQRALHAREPQLGSPSPAVERLLLEY
jgi:hypothetical protein